MKKYLVLTVLLITAPAWADFECPESTTTTQRLTTSTILPTTTIKVITTTIEPTTTSIELTTTIEEITTTTIEGTTTQPATTTYHPPPPPPTTSVRPTTTTIKPTTTTIKKRTTTTTCPLPPTTTTTVFDKSCIEGSTWAYKILGHERARLHFENEVISVVSGRKIPALGLIKTDGWYTCSTATLHEIGLFWDSWLLSTFDCELGTGKALKIGGFLWFWNVDGVLYCLPIPTFLVFNLERIEVDDKK